MLPLVFSVVLSIPIIHVEILSSGPRVAFEWPSSGHGVALERSVRLIPNRNRSVVDPSIKIERYSRTTTDYFNMDDRNRQYCETRIGDYLIMTEPPPNPTTS